MGNLKSGMLSFFYYMYGLVFIVICRGIWVGIPRKGFVGCGAPQRNPYFHAGYSMLFTGYNWSQRSPSMFISY